MSYSDATTEYDLWNTVRLAVSLSVMGLVSRLKERRQLVSASRVFM